jgi:hypothetical protein
LAHRNSRTTDHGRAANFRGPVLNAGAAVFCALRVSLIRFYHAHGRIFGSGFRKLLIMAQRYFSSERE